MNLSLGGANDASPRRSWVLLEGTWGGVLRCVLVAARWMAPNMRVIASAQQSLHEMVEQGTFRRDLYFRLNVVNIKLSPLRERHERIVPLFLDMVRQEADNFNYAPPLASNELLQQLLCHAWLGNVRELRSTAKRFVLGLEPLSVAPMETQVGPLNLKDRLQQIEKILIEESLRRHAHNVEEVAVELRIAKRTLYYRMKQLDISLN